MALDQNILRKLLSYLEEMTDSLEIKIDMRNILVHQYFEVDPAEIIQAVTKDLNDLREFARAINGFLEKNQQENP